MEYIKKHPHAVGLTPISHSLKLFLILNKCLEEFIHNCIVVPTSFNLNGLTKKERENILDDIRDSLAIGSPTVLENCFNWTQEDGCIIPQHQKGWEEAPAFFWTRISDLWEKSCDNNIMYHVGTHHKLLDDIIN